MSTHAAQPVPSSASAHDLYQSPLSGRYASRAMRELFSDRKRFETWRRIWVELARAEHQLGLGVSAAHVAELADHVAMTPADFEAAQKREKEVRHDVMAHVHTFGLAAPSAAGIIHLGATSADITDNADLIIYREALGILHSRLIRVLRQLAAFAEKYAAVPTLGFTHYQPAMPTTVGKRACLWLQDFLHDAQELERVRFELPFRGLKGATGTQASFLELFHGDGDKVQSLEARVAAAFGFTRTVPITGQTYPRRLDAWLLGPVALLADSAGKFASDLRLLAHEREIEEPFEDKQIGSSAMPFKRNPMRCERINSLARSLSHLIQNAHATAQAQWLERTLDDSANRRITLAESFLLADSILLVLDDVTNGLVVYEATIAANLNRELPFLASEPILMAAVEKGGNRQELHERLRQHAIEAAAKVKAGQPNDLAARFKRDEVLSKIPGLDIDALLNPSNPIHVGRAPSQVAGFMRDAVKPYLQKFQGMEPPTEKLRV